MTRIVVRVATVLAELDNSNVVYSFSLNFNGLPITAFESDCLSMREFRGLLSECRPLSPAHLPGTYRLCEARSGHIVSGAATFVYDVAQLV